jgi:nucleoside phosphorylase
MAPLDPEAVADALAVLGDVSEWRLPAPRWDRVASILAAMAEARDSAALLQATVDLELAGPTRFTPLGSTPRVPPPPRVHTLRNHLVHSLSAMSPQPLPEPPRRAGASTDDLVKQYLVVHAFAPATDTGYDRVRQLWDGCGSVLGMTKPIDALGLPVSLPSALPAGSAVAARRSEQAEAIVRREHDVVLLSVAAMAPETTWAGWAARWQEAAGGGDDGTLIGTVTIFAGTVAGTPDAAIRTVAGALPPTVDDFWQSDSAEVGAGTLWQLPPFGDGRRRRLVVLAPADREAELSALVWSRGDTELTPLTQYLLHASKAYYERCVRDTIALLPTDQPRLAELSDAVLAARRNMSRSLRAAGLPADPSGGPLGADLEAADTLLEQLELDQRYVRRAAAGPGTRPTIGLVTVLPEEFAAMDLLLDDAADGPVARDRAVYRRGRLPSADPARPHEVVLTMLTETGTDAAAHGEAHLVRSFPSVDQLIMVGIAAGVPRPRDPTRHVRLGDVVAGTWNVVDFDHVVDRPAGPERRQEFPRRSALLAARVKLLVAGEIRGARPWETHLDRLIAEAAAFARPDEGTDVVFSDDSDFARPVPHPDPESTGHRPGRPKVHEGRIGSSDRSMRNAASRDEFAGRHHLHAIEMEGTGIGRGSHADGRDWFVVRGISDYGDRWTDSTWRRYAAAAAAAYVRALLAVCPPVDPHGGHVGGSAPADP